MRSSRKRPLSPITIYVNSEPAATLFATPTDQAELAIGYLTGEGILKTYHDIRDVSWSEETTSVKVRTRPKAQVRIEAVKVIKVLRSACGSSEDFYRLLDRIDKPIVRSDFRVSASEIVSIVTKFSEQSEKRRTTGSLQYAAVFFEGEMKAFFEDVGLDNAVSKALGSIIRNGLEPSQAVLVSSGRQSALEVIRAARVGVPVLASLRGATYSGVRAAEKTGVTLCCFVKEQGMSIYSTFDRITLDK